MARFRADPANGQPVDGLGLTMVPVLLLELARVPPVWMLTGEHEPATALLLQLLASMSEPERYEMDVVAGVDVRGFSTPAVQEAVLDRTAAWASRTIERGP